MSKENRDDLKEIRRQDREDTRALEDCFKLNVGNNPDRLLAILQGNYKPPSLPGESDRITAPVDGDQWHQAKMKKAASTKMRPMQSDDEESDDVEMATPPQYENEPGYKRPKFASVVEELEMHRFAADPDRRQRQMAIIANTVKATLQDLPIQEVADNTKRAFGKHVTATRKIAGGLQVTFDFDNSIFTVAAMGPFSGEETVCVYKNQNKVSASIMRIKGEDYVDLSGKFAIQMGTK